MKNVQKMTPAPLRLRLFLEKSTPAPLLVSKFIQTPARVLSYTRHLYTSAARRAGRRAAQNAGPTRCRTGQDSGLQKRASRRAAEQGGPTLMYSPSAGPNVQTASSPCCAAGLITIRFVGWIFGRIVSLQPDTDI